MDEKPQKPLRDLLASLVPPAVLAWALSILTAGYLGFANNIDAAFISSLVTSVLAGYGITKIERDNNRNNRLK